MQGLERKKSSNIQIFFPKYVLSDCPSLYICTRLLLRNIVSVVVVLGTNINNHVCYHYYHLFVIVTPIIIMYVYIYYAFKFVYILQMSRDLNHLSKVDSNGFAT